MSDDNWPPGKHYVEDANLPAAFFANVEDGGDSKLLFEKVETEWRGHSWRLVADDVRRLAAVLVNSGVEAGDRVMISAENRPEWAIADLAIMSIGAIVVPAYTTNTEDDHHFIMDHSGATVVITSGGMLATRLALAANRALSVHTMIVMSDAFTAPDGFRPNLHYWGAAIAGADPLADIDTRISAQRADDVCCFIYTSGTGGRPKGVMLTHRSVQANITAAIELLREGNVVDNQRFLSLLPLSHSYEHTAGMHLPFQIKAEVWYCESTDQIANNLDEVSPTLMTAVPRLYEVLHDRIMRGVRASPCGDTDLKKMQQLSALVNPAIQQLLTFPLFRQRIGAISEHARQRGNVSAILRCLTYLFWLLRRKFRTRTRVLFPLRQIDGGSELTDACLNGPGRALLHLLAGMFNGHIDCPLAKIVNPFFIDSLASRSEGIVDFQIRHDVGQARLD